MITKVLLLTVLAILVVDLSSTGTTSIFVGASSVSSKLMKNWESQLVTNLTIDWKHPPWKQEFGKAEPACHAWSDHCSKAYFSSTLEMIDGSKLEQNDWTRPKSTNLTAYHTIHTEMSLINVLKTPARFSLSDTVSATETTTGWTISAKVSGGVTGPTYLLAPALGIEISAVPPSATMANKTQKQKLVEGYCSPNHHCTIETWTFHTRVSGICHRRVAAECGKQLSVCRLSNVDWKCDQFREFRQEWCRGDIVPILDCEVRLPVYDVFGQPLVSTILKETPLGKGKSDKRRLHDLDACPPVEDDENTRIVVLNGLYSNPAQQSSV